MKTQPHTELLSDLLGSSVGALSSQSFTMWGSGEKRKEQTTTI